MQGWSESLFTSNRESDLTMLLCKNFTFKIWLHFIDCRLKVISLISSQYNKLDFNNKIPSTLLTLQENRILLTSLLTFEWWLICFCCCCSCCWVTSGTWVSFGGAEVTRLLPPLEPKELSPKIEYWKVIRVFPEGERFWRDPFVLPAGVVFALLRAHSFDKW